MSKYTILLIDYEPRSIESLKTPLESVGYEVVVASDGIAGVERFDRLKPDLTLVEAMIPKKHGFEVCQQLKATDHGSRTPIAILTAVYKGRKYRTQALHNYKCDEYLEKPIEADRLLQTVGRLLKVDDPYRPLGDSADPISEVEVIQEVVPEEEEAAEEIPIPSAPPVSRPVAMREPLPFDLTGADENEIMSRLDEILIEDEDTPAAAAATTATEPPPHSPDGTHPAEADAESPSADTGFVRAVPPQLAALDESQLDEALSVLDARLDSSSESTGSIAWETPVAEPETETAADGAEEAEAIDEDRPQAGAAAREAIDDHPEEVEAAGFEAADGDWPEVDPTGVEAAREGADLVSTPEELDETVPDSGAAGTAAGFQSGMKVEVESIDDSIEGTPHSGLDDTSRLPAPDGDDEGAPTTEAVAVADDREAQPTAADTASRPDIGLDTDVESDFEAEAAAEGATGQVVDFDSHRSKKRGRKRGKKGRGRKAKTKQAVAGTGGSAAVAAAPESELDISPAVRSDAPPERAAEPAVAVEPAASVEREVVAPPEPVAAGASRGVPAWIWAVAAVLVVGGATGLFLLRGSGATTTAAAPNPPASGSTGEPAASDGSAPALELAGVSPAAGVAESSAMEPTPSNAEAENLSATTSPSSAGPKTTERSAPTAAPTSPKRDSTASNHNEPKRAEQRAGARTEPKAARRETSTEAKPLDRGTAGTEPKPADRGAIPTEPSQTRQARLTESTASKPESSPVEADSSEVAAPETPLVARSSEPSLGVPDRPAVTPPSPSRALPVVPKQREPERVDWTGKLVDARDVDAMPRALDRKLPDYTHRAMRLRQQGRVELRVLVDEKGLVSAVEVTKPIPNSDLNDAAVDAVKRWRFSPATKEGQPVKTWITESVTFRL